MRSALTRVVVVLVGLCLLVGFFLPWFKLAGLASISGFGLMTTGGAAAEMFGGAHRVLLFAVPLLGVLLIAGGVTGHRAAAGVALVSGVLVIGHGLVTLMTLFFSTTGLGMWLVIFGALGALGIGLLSLGRR